MFILARNWSTHSLASCRKIDFLRFSLIFSAKWPRKPWKRTFLKFSHVSEAVGAIAEVAAEALAAHFSGVFMWFCGRGSSCRSGRGSPGSALFTSFHMVLWPRKLSQKLPRKLWQRTFLEFSRGSVAAEAIAEVAAEALAAHFSRVFT